jgi:hypothetical protein
VIKPIFLPSTETSLELLSSYRLYKVLIFYSGFILNDVIAFKAGETNSTQNGRL